MASKAAKRNEEVLNGSGGGHLHLPTRANTTIPYNRLDVLKTVQRHRT